MSSATFSENLNRAVAKVAKAPTPSGSQPKNLQRRITEILAVINSSGARKLACRGKVTNDALW